jgi:hypothetical protein
MAEDIEEEDGEGHGVELLIEKFLVRATQPCSMKSIFSMKELEVSNESIRCALVYVNYKSESS